MTAADPPNTADPPDPPDQDGPGEALPQRHRITRVVTKTGDAGSTSVADGRRRRKHDARIEALGDIDELNATLGLLLSHLAPDDALTTHLAPIQHRLFDLGGGLAMPDVPTDCSGALLHVDGAIAVLGRDMPPLTEFILPGGSTVVAQAHVARTVARRAERALVRLADSTDDSLPEDALAFVNRLSDLLFIACRLLARRDGSEVLWQR